MSTRRTRGIAAGIAALAMVASATTAANADAFRHRDATGDVRFYPDGSTVSHVDSRKSDPDIQQFTVLHGYWALSVATSIREVNKYTNRWDAYIETSKGDRFIVQRGIDEETFKVGLSVFRNGKAFTCSGVYVSRTSSGIVAKVPTRCLGNPWKVRVGVVSGSEYGCCGGQGWDDAMRNGAVTLIKPWLSPWIAR